jgi:hypothetical protein
MSQFVTLPPLEKIAQLFQAATGYCMENGMMWKSWNTLSVESLTWVRPYIRPCHQAILNETVGGAQPLALLRQLLRPYDYRIEAGNGGWTLRAGKPEKGVRVNTTAKRIDWSD